LLKVRKGIQEIATKIAPKIATKIARMKAKGISTQK